MLRLNPTSEKYAYDLGAQKIWKVISEYFQEFEGTGYYQFPDITLVPPDFLVSVKGMEPFIVRTIQCSIGEISEIKNEVWNINNHYVDSPIYEAEDELIGLKNMIENQRKLRNRVNPFVILAFPFIRYQDFSQKFGSVEIPYECIWQDKVPMNLKRTIQPNLNDDEMTLLRAVIQGATPLIKPGISIENKSSKMGEALAILERRITALDTEQDKAANQIAPGIQVIKGLAGTGKTVLLAMKAAHIHYKFPERKILFTFHTQSLYNQTKNLISDFYSLKVKSDPTRKAKPTPDWNQVIVKHAWGGKNKAGVYYDLAHKLGISPLDLGTASKLSHATPFLACCAAIVNSKIEPEYDYILVDEAQDFPKEFFQILYKLTRPPKAIYIAFDELQNLSTLKNSNPSEWFGKDENGKYVFTTEEDYPGPIEKEIVLKYSYRCPRTVLMLAHAVGLGLNSPTGCVQIVPDESSWTSIGYQIVSGKCEEGENIKIFRSEENSPNPIQQIYSGIESLVTIDVFTRSNLELKSVSQSIINSIKNEGMPPDQIVVVSLTNKVPLIELQRLLWAAGINSIVPGVIDEASEFREKGSVTLSNVYRAKGNEAGLVYVINADQMGRYANEIEARNEVFTAISRAKAWVRISGSGPHMISVANELNEVLKRIPYFEFVFPDPNKVPGLTALASSRKREINKAKRTIRDLTTLDIGALQEQDPESLRIIKQRIEEALRDKSE